MSFPHAPPLTSQTGGYDPLLGGYRSDGELAVNECDSSGGCSGGRWGRIGGGAERVKSFPPAHARTRWNQVGGVLRLATELLPNDSLTWHVLLPMGNISARWWLSTERPTRSNFEYHGTQFCAVVAIDRTTTETTRSDADNGKRTRPPTRPHETVAVSPFSDCLFSITLTGLW